VIELDEGVIDDANLFDLVGRTLRFVPDGAGYRVENLPLVWESGQAAEVVGGRGGRRGGGKRRRGPAGNRRPGS
jgi:hypothetical protein